MSLSLKDFYPVNTWTVDVEGPKYSCTFTRFTMDGGTLGRNEITIGLDRPMYIIDQSTGKKYLNESNITIRLKCFLLALGTPIVSTIASTITVAYRIVKLLTLSHFWLPTGTNEPYNFKKRLSHAGNDILQIALQPIALLGLELAAIYGILRPHDGRKLYASFEKAAYQTPILAPCFAPDAKRHLCGAPLNEQDGW